MQQHDWFRTNTFSRVAWLGFVAVTCIALTSSAAAEDRPQLTLVVMDPLAAPLACACVQGYAQRRYERLGEYLSEELDRPVRVAFGESLQSVVNEQTGGKADLVVGKDSVVRYDAKQLKRTLQPLAALTGKDGSTAQYGLFVVPADDPAKTLSDLKGYKILFGPVESEEKHAAAVAALVKAGVPRPAADKLEIREACSEGACDILDEGAGAAVISSYAKPLLEGCGTIERGALRVVGRTADVPFITAFAGESLDETTAQQIRAALLAVGKDEKLCSALETQQGFVAYPGEKKKVDAPPNAEAAPADWPRFRGPKGDAVVSWLPKTLPDEPPIVWELRMTRPVLAGIAATDKYVIVADRGLDEQTDIWRCVDAGSGQQLWQLQYSTTGELDWGNSPRATPLIHEDRAYLLGAYGDLHCVRIADGKTVWKRSVVVEFGAAQLKWGMCISPIVVDGKLIVSPGAKDASLAALDPKTGKTIWKTPGRPAAYATFMAATFGGRRQLVGYDASTLGGWDIATGRRLWELIPENEGDFNVPSPIEVDGKLLVTTENNCTRLFDFADDGTIKPQPLADNWDLYPDTATPVVVAGKIFCGFGGELFCLDLGGNGKKPLEVLWTAVDDAYLDHSSIIGHAERILVAGSQGELLLVSTRADRYELLGRLNVFGEDCELISHPALVGTRLFIRDGTRLLCLELKEE